MAAASLNSSNSVKRSMQVSHKAESHYAQWMPHVYHFGTLQIIPRFLLITFLSWVKLNQLKKSKGWQQNIETNQTISGNWCIEEDHPGGCFKSSNFKLLTVPCIFSISVVIMMASWLCVTNMWRGGECHMTHVTQRHVMSWWMLGGIFTDSPGASD